MCPSSVFKIIDEMRNFILFCDQVFILPKVYESPLEFFMCVANCLTIQLPLPVNLQHCYAPPLEKSIMLPDINNSMFADVSLAAMNTLYLCGILSLLFSF